MAKKKKTKRTDEELRKEVSNFTNHFNSQNKTNIKVSTASGAQHRKKGEFGRKTVNHVRFGGTDFIASGKKKDQEKFIDTMAESGFRVIDERKAKGSKGGNRGVIHVDANTTDRNAGNTRTGPRGQKFRENRKGRYVNTGISKQKYQTEEKKDVISKLKESSKKEPITGLSDFNQGGQSKERISQEVKSSPMKKKLSLKEKLQGLSQIDPEGSNTKENINAVLENDPTQLVPQITPTTPRLAMIQDEEGNRLSLRQKAAKVSQPPKTDASTAKQQRAVENEVVAKNGQVNQQEAAEQLLRDRPEETAELIAQQAPPESYNDIKQDLYARQTGAPRKGGPTSQFTEALTFFLPQIIGGLAGAAIEGTTGAVAGIDSAGKMRDAFLSHKDKQLDREARTGTSETERRRLDIAEANLGLRKDKQTLDLAGEKRRNKKLDLDIDKFGLTTKQAGQLSGKQTDQLKDMNSVELSIDRIEELRKETNTGPLAGRVQSMAQWADAAPESFNKMKAQAASTLSNYVKSISGAQVAEAEAVRLQSVIPSVNDAPGVFKDKLEEFKKIVQMNKQAFAQAIATGQPLKAGAVKGLLEAEKKFSKKKSSAVKSGFSREDIDAMKAKIRAERDK